MWNRLIRPIARSVQRGTRQSHSNTSSGFKYATMDELPVPTGSWQAQYDAYQKKYNIQLAAGIIIFLATFTIAKASGALFLNAYPPLPKEKN